MDAVSLQIANSGEEPSVSVVVSHDCDLAADAEDDPSVEVITGRCVEKPDGQLAFAKHPRRLVLEFNRNGKATHVQLDATGKVDVQKSELASFKPDPSVQLSDGGRWVLASWLALRYKRQALADDLVTRLRPVLRQFEKLGKDGASGVIAYYIDYQPRLNTLQEAEPYELWINVVYASERPEGAGQAATIAAKLKKAISDAFYSAGRWEQIDLRHCEAVSDEDFTVADLRRSIDYKLEHLSLRQTPSGPTIA